MIGVKIERAFEIFREEKSKEGYPSELIEKSLKFAEQYLNTITSFLKRGSWLI